MTNETTRENLDPFNEHSDEDCLNVLSRVQLNTAESSSTVASHRASRTASRAASVYEGSDAGASPPSATTSQTGTTQFDDHKQSIVSLKTKVSAGGANFSQGQRQLIAMARALLRQSSIIIMVCCIACFNRLLPLMTDGWHGVGPLG